MQVPEVHILARAFVPSSSFIAFRLAHGLEFVTFVNTVPIDANRSGEQWGQHRKSRSQVEARRRGWSAGRVESAWFRCLPGWSAGDGS